MKPKKASQPAPTYSVSNCHFETKPLAIDADTLEAVRTVAKALLNLTEVFKGTGVNVPMLHIGPEK